MQYKVEVQTSTGLKFSGMVDVNIPPSRGVKLPGFRSAIPVKTLDAIRSQAKMQLGEEIRAFRVLDVV